MTTCAPGYGCFQLNELNFHIPWYRSYEQTHKYGGWYPTAPWNYTIEWYFACVQSLGKTFSSHKNTKTVSNSKSFPSTWVWKSVIYGSAKIQSRHVVLRCLTDRQAQVYMYIRIWVIGVVDSNFIIPRRQVFIISFLCCDLLFQAWKWFSWLGCGKMEHKGVFLALCHVICMWIMGIVFIVDVIFGYKSLLLLLNTVY